MIALHYKRNTPQYTGLVYTGSHLAWVNDGHAFGVVLAAGAVQVEVDDEQLLGIIKSTVKATPCPPALVGDLKDFWV